MVNLIAGRRVVPELLQENFNPDALAATVAPLLGDTPTPARQIADLAEVRRQLIPDPAADPIARAAQIVLQLLEPSPKI
jgi:lipid-A-disaccharide synthase